MTTKTKTTLWITGIVIVIGLYFINKYLYNRPVNNNEDTNNEPPQEEVK